MMSRLNILSLKGVLVASCTVLVSSVVCINSTSAATIGYWELDGDNIDAVGSWDLSDSAGDSASANTSTKATILNPDSSTPWNGGTGGDDSATNPASENFSANRLSYTASTFPQFKQSQGFTIEGFIQPTASPLTKQTVVTTRTSASGVQGWEVYRHSNGAIYFGVLTNGFGANAQIGGTTVPLNEWTHFAAVWDPSTGVDGELRLYLDGDLEYSAGGNPGFDDDGEGGELQIGGQRAESPRDLFDGQLDEFRYSDTALAPSEFLNVAVPEPSTLSFVSLATVFGLLGRRKN